MRCRNCVADAPYCGPTGSVPGCFLPIPPIRAPPGTGIRFPKNRTGLLLGMVPLCDSHTLAFRASRGVCLAGNHRSSIWPANCANRRECNSRYPIRVIHAIRGRVLLLFHLTAMWPRRRSAVPSVGPAILVACNAGAQQSARSDVLLQFLVRQSISVPQTARHPTCRRICRVVSKQQTAHRRAESRSLLRMTTGLEGHAGSQATLGVQ